MNRLFTTLTVLFAVSTGAHANITQPTAFKSPGEAVQGIAPTPAPETTPPAPTVTPNTPPATGSCPENNNNTPNDIAPDDLHSTDVSAPPVQGM